MIPFGVRILQRGTATRHVCVTCERSTRTVSIVVPSDVDQFMRTGKGYIYIFNRWQIYYVCGQEVIPSKP